MSQNSSLLFKTKIGLKDNFSLIDYDSTQLIINRMNINKSGTVFRSGRDTYFKENSEKQNENEKELLKIIKDPQNDCYFINPGKYSNDINKLNDEKPAYLVYKNSFFDEDRVKKDKIFYQLSEGDIIKIGRVFIKILKIQLQKVEKNSKKYNNSIVDDNKDINYTSMRKNLSCSSFIIKGQEVIKGSCSGLYYNNNDFEDERNSENIFNIYKKVRHNKKLILPKVNSINNIHTSRIPYKIKIKSKENSDSIDVKNENKEINLKIFRNKKICRICYGDKDKFDSENPLISPCICKGSMKYIHYKCLRNWLDSKIESSPLSSIELKDNIGICYCKENFECELCKTKFPDYININGKLLNLTFYKTSFEKFLIFESVQIENNNKSFIHILSFDKKNKISIGRANDCDISFPENSVSRQHCFIHYNEKKEKLFLEDNSSRFGSLVLIQNPYLLMIENLSLNIQKDDTYIKIKLNLPFNLFSCCSIRNNNYKKFNSYQEQNENHLNIYNSFIIKKNDINEDNDENDYYEEEIKKIRSKRNSNLINLFPKENKNHLFLKILKNIDYKKYKINKEILKLKDNKTIFINENNNISNDFETQRIKKSNKRISISLINRENKNNNKSSNKSLNLFSLNENTNILNQMDNNENLESNKEK